MNGEQKQKIQYTGWAKISPPPSEDPPGVQSNGSDTLLSCTRIESGFFSQTSGKISAPAKSCQIILQRKYIVPHPPFTPVTQFRQIFARAFLLR